MKTCQGGGMASHIHSLGRPRRFIPTERAPQYPLHSKLGGCPEEEKHFLLMIIDADSSVANPVP
jgi:hypothetical protein